MDYFDYKVWENWANNNYDEFKSLKDGAKIAMLLPDTDNLIVLKKGGTISVVIDDRNTFEFPFAQIAFKFGENTIESVLNDSTFKTFKNLTLADDIGILSFVDEATLNRFDYRNFLKKFGFQIGSGCSCGCC
ncbi:hypothetical protein [Methanobrevibacter sp.]|uniref:hypothetical protein n=1 Tax=Methanobrevibacter sp. TaxID=66852 RepID=UPI003890573C